MVTIETVDGSPALDAARVLFLEYAATLEETDLAYQGFAAELAGLPGSYVAPEGALLIARVDDAVAGCVALRPLEGRICEMKRMYVRPGFRGHGVGFALAQAVIARARGAGYEAMRLDTLGSMRAAQALYRAIGFREIARYYATPVADTVFMELRLR